ncbi:MAG TPA: Xaa-Pro peptidase family protein [Solirubrobacteraceae bacterium]|jgi:Xaa-Pro aminopeptidase|nr:Xaa-Pro peptidase family protein [Solirubrobacteraceae bacterium]
MSALAPSPTPSSEFGARWQRALAECGKRGLDGLLAVSRGASSIDSYADVFYLSGHYGNIGFTPDFQDYWVGRSHSAVVLVPDREPLLIVDGADYRRDLIGIEEVRFALDFPAAVAQALRDLGLDRGRVGVAGLNVMSARVHRLLCERLGGCELHDADDLLEALRVIKSPFELQRIRAATQIGDAVVTTMMEHAQTAGTIEAHAVAEGYRVGVAAGVHFFDTSIASGPYSNYFTHNHLPSWSQRVLQPGDIFHADSYGAVEGYLFDFGRTCIVGSGASAEQAALCQGAIDAVEAGIALIRPGVPASAVFDAVHGHLLSVGLATDEQEEMDMENASALSIGFPPHGHGFGLGWEWPWILPTEERLLEPGMCLAVEAMPTKPGLGSSYFEQDIVVADDGYELLTQTTKRWW